MLTYESIEQLIIYENKQNYVMDKKFKFAYILKYHKNDFCDLLTIAQVIYFIHGPTVNLYDVI